MVFTLRPSAHLRRLATLAGVGTIVHNSNIARFVQGGVVKTFRYVTSTNPMARIRGLVVPPLLVEMIRDGRWQHPGDEVLTRVVPFMSDPLDFLTSLDAIRFNSSLSLGFSGEPLRIHCRWFRSSKLPWLNMRRAFFIAINRNIGDDVAIALDYRTNSLEPRVVASEYTDANGYRWCAVADTFSAFVESLAI